MVVSGFRGAGTVFSRGDGASPEVFNTVTNVISITGPQISKEDIEVTHLGSTAKEFISALDDPGELQLQMNWDPSNAQHVGMRSDAEGSTTRNYRIVWNDASSTQVDFLGEAMDFSLDTQPNAAVVASVRVKISGALTWS